MLNVVSDAKVLELYTYNYKTPLLLIFLDQN